MGGLCNSTKDTTDKHENKEVIVHSNRNIERIESKKEESKEYTITHIKKIDEEEQYEKVYNSLPEKFQDEPFIDEAKIVNEGIKRDKAYYLNIKIDELNDKRDEFWLYLYQIHPNYKEIIKKIILSSRIDHLQAKDVLAQSELEICSKEGNMKLLKYNNTYFRIPNWIFNDPLIEKKMNIKSENRIELPKKEENEVLSLVDVYKNKKYVIRYNQDLTGNEIKDQYSKILQQEDSNIIDLSQLKIRLIYNGCEIKNTETLFNHNVKPKSFIQIIVSSIE